MHPPYLHSIHSILEDELIAAVNAMLKCSNPNHNTITMAWYIAPRLIFQCQFNCGICFMIILTIYSNFFKCIHCMFLKLFFFDVSSTMASVL